MLDGILIIAQNELAAPSARARENPQGSSKHKTNKHHYCAYLYAYRLQNAGYKIFLWALMVVVMN